MNIILKIEEDYKEALKNKDDLKISTLRLLKNAIHNLEIEKQHTLSQEEIQMAMNREIKQRREAILEYRKAQREDLAKKEENEIEIISVYLPPQLSQEEIKKVVQNAISQTNAKSLGDFGNVMKIAMQELKGKADGSIVSEIVKEALRKGA